MKNSFKNLSYQELKAKRDELKKKYMEFRFKIVIGHVDNPLQKRTMRRQIARLNTLIGAHERSADGGAKKLNSVAGAK
ncbi:MAG: 50S ribosomal protein L29 [Treponema sp.]|jgi:large subunit ribosomal protein L29|nr:50S ribosomal protein L29 [Treponema sp.]